MFEAVLFILLDTFYSFETTSGDLVIIRLLLDFLRNKFIKPLRWSDEIIASLPVSQRGCF